MTRLLSSVAMPNASVCRPSTRDNAEGATTPTLLGMVRQNAALLALLALLAGCRAPTPSMNVFAPYGSATVPPPPTGTLGNGAGYYSSPTTPPNAPATPPATALPPAGAGYGAIPSTASGTATLASAMGEPTPATRAYGVAQASYQPGSTSGTGLSGIAAPGTSGAVDSADESPSTLRIKGMPVNDATVPAEPQAGSASANPTDLATLPAANASSPSLLRIISSRSSTGTVPANASPTPPSTGNWQTR